MQHVPREAGPRRTVSALEPPHRDALRHRLRRDCARQRIVLRPLTEPQLADIHVAKDGSGAPGVVVVVVRESQHVKAPASLSGEARHHDLVTCIEAAVSGRSRIHESEPSVFPTQDHGEPLAYVDDLDRSGTGCRRRGTEMQSDRAQREEQTDPTGGPAAERARPAPCDEKQGDVGGRQGRRRRSHAEVTPRNGDRQLRHEQEGRNRASCQTGGRGAHQRERREDDRAGPGREAGDAERRGGEIGKERHRSQASECNRQERSGREIRSGRSLERAWTATSAFPRRAAGSTPARRSRERSREIRRSTRAVARRRRAVPWPAPAPPADRRRDSPTGRRDRRTDPRTPSTRRPRDRRTPRRRVSRSFRRSARRARPVRRGGAAPRRARSSARCAIR